MFEFCVLSSSSKGNCTYLRCGDTKFLIDCGISAKQLRMRLDGIGVRLEDIQAVFITHEHSDHIRGLEVFLKQNPVAVFASQGTHHACIEISKTFESSITPFDIAKPIQFQSVELWPFSIPHDARQPVMYRVESHWGSLAIATDIGHVAAHIPDYIRGVDALVLEANHDPELLKTSPYPASVKKRIHGDNGHLSNGASANLFSSVLKADVLPEVVVAAHISENSNTEELALETLRCAGRDFIDPAKFVAGSPKLATDLFSLNCSSEVIDCFDDVV